MSKFSPSVYAPEQSQRIKPCDECIDPTHNPGYHMNEGDEYPQLYHKHLDTKFFKSPLLLDIGAGGYSSDEKFTSVDLVTEADIRATMWDIPLPDESVDGIYTSNALEHVPQKMVVPTLIEWHRLLKPEGKLQLIVPDLEWACQWWLAHQEDTGWSLAILFGHQNHDGEFHLTGFTPQMLMHYLTETAKPWGIHKVEYLGGSGVDTIVTEDIYTSDANQRLINVEASKLIGI